MPPRASTQRWLQFQQLAARIYEKLSPHARVVHNDRIRGGDSGRMRQIDVSIRTHVAGHELLIIVQAKALKAVIDVNHVGELAQVMKDVRAAKAILVSNSGFSDGAQNLARASGIDLCSIHDASSSEWPLTLTFPILWIERTPQLRLAFTIQGSPAVTADVSIPKDPRRWSLSRDGGSTSANVFQEFVDYWTESPDHRLPARTHEWRPQGPPLSMNVLPGVWLRVDDFTISYSAVAKGWLGNLKISDCCAVRTPATDTLATHIRLTGDSIPLTRDPAWTAVDDPDGVAESTTTLIILETSDISVDTLGFTDMSLTPSNERCS